MKQIKFELIFGVVILTLLSSCKKEYSCECNAYSTQKIEFTEYKTVQARNTKKADEECIRLGAEYNPNDYSALNVQFVNCNYKP